MAMLFRNAQSIIASYWAAILSALCDIVPGGLHTTLIGGGRGATWIGGVSGRGGTRIGASGAPPIVLCGRCFTTCTQGG